MRMYSLVNDWLCGGVNHSTVPWQHTCPGLNFAISISLCTGLISCGPYCEQMKQDDYEMNTQQMRSTSQIKWDVVISNRPFYSCVLRYLAYECKRGWRWPCFDTDLSAFSLKGRLVSIRATWFTQQKKRGLYQNKVSSSFTAIQRPGHLADNCKMVYYITFLAWFPTGTHFKWSVLTEKQTSFNLTKLAMFKLQLHKLTVSNKRLAYYGYNPTYRPNMHPPYNCM